MAFKNPPYCIYFQLFSFLLPSVFCLPIGKETIPLIFCSRQIWTILKNILSDLKIACLYSTAFLLGDRKARTIFRATKPVKVFQQENLICLGWWSVMLDPAIGICWTGSRDLLGVWLLITHRFSVKGWSGC